MGKKIRSDFFCIVVLVLVFFPLFNSTGFSQIPITDSRSFEVSFSDQETKQRTGGIDISVRDPLIASPVPGRPNARAERFTSSNGQQRDGAYFVEAYGDISIGRYYHRSDDHILVELPFRNETSKSLDKLSVAFDFIYLPEKVERPHDFYLSYRTNGGEWYTPGQGTFSTEFLRPTDRGWGTFSMQISLDQLYLRPGDEIDLRWSSAAAIEGDEELFFPVALQKIEFFPSVADTKQIRPGSLIVTEILPLHRTGRGFAEYVEIYNSTEEPINLKGLILESGYDEIVIQRQLIAEPYQSVVIANYEGLNRFDSYTDYKYSGTLLGSLSGRLEARFEGGEVARALYDVSEPGVAHQLDHLQNAYDGYSSMRHLVPVRSELQHQIYGSPGRIDKSRKLYTKTISTEGWHLITPPGVFPASLNREAGRSLTSLDTAEETDTDRPTPPFLYYHESEKPATFYSAGINPESAERSENAVNLKHLNVNVLAHHMAAAEPMSINKIINPGGSQAFPALLGWDEKKQSFRLLWDRDDIISPWSTVFTPAISGDQYETRVLGADSDEDAWTGINHAVQLSLLEESGSDGVLIRDHALVGFWDAPSEVASERMDLPKMWSPIQEASGEQRPPMIYLKSAEASHQANSYLNFARRPGELVQVSVGIRLQQTNGRYRIEWNHIDTLPEHWELEFVDADLDEVVDMRREQSYSFFERSEDVLTGMNDPDLNFMKVEETDYNRFFIRVSSTGSLGMFERENESPESIELRQNYPNPFNPTTTVVFYLPKSSHVKLGVYNVVGQHVGVLKDERLSAGEHTVTWNAMDMPSGVYIVQLEAGNTVNTRKITLIK